jgi:putative ABC transport system permease protein
MKLNRYVQPALLNLMAAKLRSFLAVLGILVGTASIVALINCGQLATETALEQFKVLGIDLIAVSIFQQNPNNSRSSQDTIPLSIWRQFPAMIPDVIQIAPYNTAYQPMSFQGKNLNGAIIGADQTLANMIHIDLAEGRFVSFVASFEHECVIGDGIARQIKELTLVDPVGKQIRMGKALYTIIGVTKPWKENGFFNEDINQSVIIPISGMPLVSKDARINNAVLLLKSDSNIDVVIERIKQTIYAQAPKLSVFVRSAKQIIASMESQGRIFTLLLGVIGGISLFVGGIGVMNVMLVSVSERKKEIGIRKAVGAKNHEIQLLFLIESVMLSLIGGVLGIVIGLIFTWIIAYFSHWNFTIYITPLLLGFLISAATGVFFGFYPARRAAVLEPIVSLRSE